MKALTKELESELRDLYSTYQPYQLHFFKKDEFERFSQSEIVAYLFSWPDTIGSGCNVDIITKQGYLFRMNYRYSDISYNDLLKIVPSLEKDVDDIRPWRVSEASLDGWHWFEIRSRCWLRIHDSIWLLFSKYAERYGAYVEHYWVCIVRKSIFESRPYPQLEEQQQKTFGEIIDDLVSNGARRYNNLRIRDVLLTEEKKYTRVTLIIDSSIPGMVSKDRGVTWEIGDTNRVFSSVYAIAGMLKEKIETSWLSDTLVEDPKEMIQIMNGGTVDIVQQLIKAGTPYKSPFAIKQTPEVVTFERDTIVSYVVGFHYGTNGQRYADMLAVKMIGF